MKKWTVQKFNLAVKKFRFLLSKNSFCFQNSRNFGQQNRQNAVTVLCTNFAYPHCLSRHENPAYTDQSGQPQSQEQTRLSSLASQSLACLTPEFQILAVVFVVSQVVFLLWSVLFTRSSVRRGRVTHWTSSRFLRGVHHDTYISPSSARGDLLDTLPRGALLSLFFASMW